MSAEAIVSCPRCIRQYVVDPALAGRVACCSICKSTFFISVGTPSLGEPVVSLIDPISPRWVFFRDGCAELARNASDALRLAGIPVTREALVEIVESLPRDRYELMDDAWRGRPCNVVLKRACGNRRTGADGVRFQELIDYFLHYIPDRDGNALDMLQNAFAGVLSVGFDTPAARITPPIRRRPFWRIWS